MITALAMIAMVGPIDIPHIVGDPLSSTSEVWRGAGLPIVAMVGRSATLKPYAEFGAIARLGWTKEGLVARIEVSDATHSPPADPERMYEGDSVELYLGLPETQQMVQLIASRSGMQFFDYREAKDRTRPLEGRSKTTPTATGYVTQLSISWRTLGIEPKAGIEVGARVAVNDGERGRRRDTLAWQEGDFFALPIVRLATMPGKAPSTAVWAAANNDLSANVLTVLADASLTGRHIRVGTLETALKSDGPRAVGQIFLPPLPSGAQSPAGTTVEIEGLGARSVELPNLAQLRRQMFQLGLQGRAEIEAFRAQFAKRIFSGPDFPIFDYRDRAAVERLVGPIEVDSKFYDAEGHETLRAERRGRYGAVVRVKSTHGGEATVYQTLFSGSSEHDAVTAAAHAEGNSDAGKADRDWWHTLRKRLGTAIQYETNLYFPGDEPAKKWPLIVYLHGSGGGDAGNWERIKDVDGPMGAAHARKEFPFAVLALRSPGGWFPPAVLDAIDAAVAGGRLDPDQIILTGFSMGGNGTWQVAYDQPSRFAAIVPVGGGRGDAARMSRLKGLPAWVINGEKDEATTAAAARAAVKALKDAGGNVHYMEIPNASHVDSLRIAYAMPELYAWMTQRRRSRP